MLPALKAMAEAGVLLLVHGEVTDPSVDMFDREAVFIQQKLVSADQAGSECRWSSESLFGATVGNYWQVNDQGSSSQPLSQLHLTWF